MLSIRLKTPVDTKPLASLFEEMQAHYHTSCPPRTQILHDLAHVPPGVDIFVADGDGLVGFACVCTLYPGPALTSGMFLKELFVSKPHRHRGIGQRLMRACAALALERGHQRLDFTANKNDGALIAFYERLGATLKAEKAFYRFDATALIGLADPKAT